MNAYELLTSIHPVSPFIIVETGCASTVGIAKWVRDNTYDFETKEGVYASFTSLSLDGNLQVAMHAELESRGLARYCTFLTQAPSKYIGKVSWVSAAFLHPDSLREGVEQFELAASAGAELIAILDYSTRAALAVTKAREWGWTFNSQGRYSVLTRRP
jgi:hypothetical protein